MTDDDYDDDHDELQGIMKDGWTYRPTRASRAGESLHGLFS